MNISIKPNDYVRPTEVRDEVVKKVCNHIVSYLDRLEVDMEISLQGAHPALFFGEKDEDMTHYKNMAKTVLSTEENYMNVYYYTRVRGCEMRKVFKLLQEAGYYIYSLNEMGWSYAISKYPYRNMYKAERVEFKSFID
jgi:endonuclease IV